MTLHRLTSVIMGVPNVTETQQYYTQFGLHPDDGGSFSTQDGGRQLRIVPTPTRRLVELHISVDDPMTCPAWPATCPGSASMPSAGQPASALW